MIIILIILMIGILVTLMRVEISSKKQIENDERIIERLDMLINDLRKSNK
ncbi:hypothetical protein SAMN04488542_117100 [Fontibacillus panacisegetis]|uniref:Uncharacterized protein n=1 Tax=Fontibacillus panacisegetis TaxID=670482 RepID=A0A1G7P5E4_9BACL|nr:hypothetical protein SAMN04488542_117100 [Fontibacillus panacisegetis]